LIADAVDGLRDTHRTAGTSLYFARVRRGRESLGGIVDQLAEAVHRCDFRAARDVLADARRSGDASNSGYLEGVQDLDGELFTYAAMLHSAEAKTSYFDHEGPLLSQETLKWAILAAGRRQKLDSKPNLVPHRRHHYAAGFKHLRRIMELCVERAPDALATADSLDRLPLHYAAMYGVSGLVDYVGKSPQTEVGTTGSELQPLELRDIEGLTPMHMTVMANQSKSVAELTDILGHNVHARPYEAEEIARELLPIALLNQSRDGNRTTTPLPLADALAAGGKRALAATQVEKASFASIMCEWLSLATDNDRGSFEVTDRRGWTPLFYACALGYYDIAKRLLDLGCSQTRTDDLGWTAQEHAALNGHLAVAELFELSELRNMNDGPARVSEKRVVHPKLYCTEGERVIVASLGSERVNDAVTEVNLPYCSSPYNPGSYDGFSYALQVSAPGTTAQPRVVRLPILDDQINEPFVFPIPATVGPQLVFRVFRQGPGTDNQGVEVGCGTALLEANTKHFGVGRQSLIRELTIPILDRDTMATAGTVTFTFMVANHFPHLRTSREVDFARNSINPPVLIGHRGLGMNLNTQKYLQIGENTVESFLAAGKLGASFVEFDFQVTKDREAVIFHDFSLSQSGTDVPVHDVTLDQFLYAGNIQSPHGNPLSVLGPIHARNEPVGQRRRSRSVGGHFEAGAIQIRDRMKHTVDYKLKGFKPNTRGDFIQDSFATLKELLVQVPEHVGFDIEISQSPSRPPIPMVKINVLTE
jgi:glycerophosphodiester phosphodiesterase